MLYHVCKHLYNVGDKFLVIENNSFKWYEHRFDEFTFCELISFKDELDEIGGVTYYQHKIEYNVDRKVITERTLITNLDDMMKEFEEHLNFSVEKMKKL